MKLELDPLERQLKETVRKALEAARTATGGVGQNIEPVWAELVALGVPGFGVPVEAGGLELGQGALLMVCEEMGRLAVALPLLDTLTAADCLEQADGGHWSERLEQIAAGEVRVGTVGLWPLAEASEVTLTEDASGWVANGEMRYVAYGSAIDLLLVSIPSGEGRSLFLLPADRSGIELVPCRNTAGVDLHHIRLSGVHLTQDERVAVVAADLPAPERVMARARLRQAAFLVGLAGGAHTATVWYTSRRQQFGRPIAEFQSVGFRLAALLGRMEAIRLKLQHTAWLEDSGSSSVLEATEALALAAELALDATREGIHLHGAYGLTVGSGIEHFYRRAALEAVRMGTVRLLWGEAGRLRLNEWSAQDKK